MICTVYLLRCSSQRDLYNIWLRSCYPPAGSPLLCSWSKWVVKSRWAGICPLSRHTCCSLPLPTLLQANFHLGSFALVPPRSYPAFPPHLIHVSPQMETLWRSLSSPPSPSIRPISTSSLYPQLISFRALIIIWSDMIDLCVYLLMVCLSQ